MCSRCSPRLLMVTFCPSPPSWWRGWRRGSLTLRFSLRKLKMKEVRIKWPSETKPQRNLTVYSVSSAGFSLRSSSECSLRASAHDLPPRRFRRAVLLPTGVDRRWSSGLNISHLRIFSCCDPRFYLWSAGSEEELDEEGLGRKAVTAQVSTPVSSSPALLSSPYLLTICLFYSLCRRRSMSDKGRRPCLWLSRSSPRRKTGNLRKTMYVHTFTRFMSHQHLWRMLELLLCIC